MEKISEKGANIVTDSIKHILREFNPAEHELCTIINCYRGKGDALERGKLFGTEISSSDLNIVERIINMLIRHQVHINETKFCLMLEHETKNAIFILRQIKE